MRVPVQTIEHPNAIVLVLANPAFQYREYEQAPHRALVASGLKDDSLSEVYRPRPGIKRLPIKGLSRFLHKSRRSKKNIPYPRLFNATLAHILHGVSWRNPCNP